MSRKSWIFLILVMSMLMVVLTLSALIRDGRFGEDLVEYANWPVYIICAIGVVLTLVFRKRIASWENSGNERSTCRIRRYRPFSYALNKPKHMISRGPCPQKGCDLDGISLRRLMSALWRLPGVTVA